MARQIYKLKKAFSKREREIILAAQRTHEVSCHFHSIQHTAPTCAPLRFLMRERESRTFLSTYDTPIVLTPPVDQGTAHSGASGEELQSPTASPLVAAWSGAIPCYPTSRDTLMTRILRCHVPTDVFRGPSLAARGIPARYSVSLEAHKLNDSQSLTTVRRDMYGNPQLTFFLSPRTAGCSTRYC